MAHGRGYLPRAYICRGMLYTQTRSVEFLLKVLMHRLSATSHLGASARVCLYTYTIHTLSLLCGELRKHAKLGEERLTATSAIMTSCGCGIEKKNSRKAQPLDQQTSNVCALFTFERTSPMRFSKHPCEYLECEIRVQLAGQPAVGGYAVYY